MADGFLERHYADYEKRKATWLKRTAHRPKKVVKTADGTALPAQDIQNN